VSKEIPNKREKNPIQRNKSRVFLSEIGHHIFIFLSLLSSDLSMSSSVSAASLNLSFYFHVPPLLYFLPLS
jgi:hypothetical protein